MAGFDGTCYFYCNKIFFKSMFSIFCVVINNLYFKFAEQNIVLNKVLGAQIFICVLKENISTWCYHHYSSSGSVDENVTILVAAKKFNTSSYFTYNQNTFCPLVSKSYY